MNRVQWKNLFREIRKNRGRFLSLLFIVALGCAFYCGIRSAEPDMTLSADRYYDDTEFCDIRIISTLGLTESDLKAVSEIPGVRSCEGGMNAELFAQGREDQPVMNVVSLGEQINRFTVMEGRLPEAADECFADVRYMDLQGAAIGDTIRLLNPDKEAPEELHFSEYTITGYGTWAWYLNLTRGTASIGDGSVDAFLVLRPEAFTQEYYTNLYLTVEGAREKNTYSAAYDTIVDQVKQRLEGISDVQILERRSAIVSEGEEAIADARQQIHDAKQELSDAEEKLKDGEAEYADGQADYEKGRKEWQESQAEYDRNLAKWQEGKAQAEEGRSSYYSGLNTYNSEFSQYESGRAAWEAGKEKLESSRQQLLEGRAAYEAGLSQWQQAGELLYQKEKEAAAGEQQLAAAEAELSFKKEEILKQQEMLQASREELLNQKKEAEVQKALLEHQKAELESLGAVPEQLSESESPDAVSERLSEPESPDAVPEQLSESETPAVLSEQFSELEAGLAQLEAGLSRLEEGIAQVEAGLAAVSDGLIEIQSGEAEIRQQKESLAEGKTALQKGREQWNAAGKELEQKRLILEAGERELASGEAELAEKGSALAEAEQELSEGRRQLEESDAQLTAAEAELAEGEAALSEAEKTLTEGEAELKTARKKLKDARKELDAGWKEYESGKEEADGQIADAEKEIAEGEQALLDLPEGDWYVLTRDEIQTSVEYGNDAERIGKIAAVFPVIFFLVAALVSLTTMTRMVEEERMLIGTMKALGYGKFSIISKYLVYAAGATLTGGVCGVLLGGKILPYVIMTAYGMLYTNVPYRLMPYHLSYSLTAIGLALLCTVGAAFAACFRELLSAPAALMRPPAPKRGRKILLERIGPVWRRLNFSVKSTIRNLFRYKKRFFMTVAGIGGCMALLLVSYGLHDSIAAIVDNQYRKVWTYSGYFGLDEKLKEEERQSLLRKVKEETEIQGVMLARNLSLDVANESVTKNAYLYVVEGTEEMEGFLDLHDRVTKERYSLTDQGVILSEKLARTLGAKSGDQVKLKISDSEYRMATVTAAAENYLLNYVYMTPALYEELYGEPPVFNECAVRYRGELTEEEENALAERLLTKKGITSVSLVRNLQETVDDMMNALNLVVWVLVIAAGLLVFVVSYNLNTINISERRRELASLKVLGFFDMEVAMYVYRENIFLTLFGILAGLFMGTWLHRYVITTLEVELIMFGRRISLASYVYCALLTLVFSVIVNVFMFYKLRQIDMVESLKSVE